jgi:hypothetical protein
MEMTKREKLARELEREIGRLRYEGDPANEHRIQLLEREVERLRQYDDREAKQGRKQGRRRRIGTGGTTGAVRLPKRITSLVSGGLPGLGKRR